MSGEHDQSYPALARLAEGLEREGASYVLVGGLAVGLWLRTLGGGVTRYRATHDIDIGAPLETVRLLQASLAPGEVQVHRLHLEGKRIDVIQIERSTGVGLEGGDVLAETHTRVEALKLPGHEVFVRVLRPAPLVVMKAVAYQNNRARTKDLVDVAALAIADLDRGQTRDELAELRALSRDFQASLDDLASRFRSLDALGPTEYAKAFSTRRLLGDENDDEELLRESAVIAVRELFSGP